MGFSSFSSYGVQVSGLARRVALGSLGSISNPPSISTLLSETSYTGLFSARYNSNGVLYFLSTGVLQKYQDNIKTRIAGNGTTGYSGDGGQAIDATIGDSRDFNFDNNGNIYVTDFKNHIIRKINTSSGIITTIAGRGGVSGKNGEGGLATSALLNQPHSIDFDNNNNMYFSSYGNKVINKIDTSGIITTIAGTGTSGFTDGTALSATFSTPTQIFLDRSTNLLYVADRFNNAIRKIDLSSNVVSTVAGNGTNGSSGDGGQALSAQLSAPVAVCVDRYGNIIIGEFRKVRKVDLNGVITVIAGTGSGGNSGDGENPVNATFSQIYKLTFDLGNNIIVSDYGNRNVRKITT